MTPTRHPGRRAEDPPLPEWSPIRKAVYRLWALPLVKEVVIVLATVWTMMGGTLQTPSAVMLQHIEAEGHLNARQDTDISDLRIALDAELAARAHGDSVANTRQLQNRFYLRLLALDRCLARGPALPRELVPYCEQLQHGQDFPDPLRP